MLQCRLAFGQERGPQQQVLRRVAADGQLGKHDDVGAVLVTGVDDHLRDPPRAGRHRADREVELGQGDAQEILHGGKPVSGIHP